MVDSELNSSSLSLTLMCCRSVCFHTNGSFLLCMLSVYAGKAKFIHMGEEVDGVDMRAEVGLLSRNILLRGEMEPSCYGNEACKFFNFDTFGGHLKVNSSVSCCLQNRQHRVNRLEKEEKRSL